MFFFIAFRSYRSTTIQTNEERDFRTYFLSDFYIQRDFILHADKMMLRNATFIRYRLLNSQFHAFVMDHIK